jgi:hypothetical protein
VEFLSPTGRRGRGIQKPQKAIWRSGRSFISTKTVEAHIFVSFLAYCLYVTLTQRLRTLAPGLTTRSVLEKFAALQMIDVHLPTADGRELILTRYTHPGPNSNCYSTNSSSNYPRNPHPKSARPKLPQPPLCSADF